MRNWYRLSLFFVLFTVSLAAFSEGSGTLYPNGVPGYRVFLQTRTPSYSSSVGFDPFSTLGSIKVYAKEGEIIYMGSSAQGKSSGGYTGKTVITAPDGTTYTNNNTGTLNVPG